MPKLVDDSEYQIIVCPKCKGEFVTCALCKGEGKVVKIISYEPLKNFLKGTAFEGLYEEKD